MLRLVSNETQVRLDLSDKPEFDSWRWVTYWHPLREIVPFKRRVYQRALHELAPLLRNNTQRPKIPTPILAIKDCNELPLKKRSQHNTKR